MIRQGLSFEVLGRPAPQGSKRAVRVPGGGVRLLEQVKRVTPYRQDVAAAGAAALEHIDDDLRKQLQANPVRVTVTFLLARPKGHHRTGRHWPALRPSAPARPAVSPDLDKMCRAALDGLTMSGAIRDDGQVVRLVAAKHYTDSGKPERTDIEVAPLALTVADAQQEAL